MVLAVVVVVVQAVAAVNPEECYPETDYSHCFIVSY